MSYAGTESDELVRKWYAAEEAAAYRLCTVGLDGSQTPIDVWPREIGDVEIVERIEERAARHANTLGGTHAFLLQVLEEDGKSVLASHAFRVGAEALPGTGALLSEPANAGGVLAQTQRHQEAIMQSTVIAWDKMGRVANQMIERADRRAARSEAAYMRVVELHQELIERSEERKEASKRADRMLEIKADSAKKLTALAPVILESIVQKKAPEGLDRASAHTARTLFESMTQEQLQGVLSSLDTEQQQIVIHLLKRLAANAEGVASEDGGADASH